MGWITINGAHIFINDSASVKDINRTGLIKSGGSIEVKNFTVELGRTYNPKKKNYSGTYGKKVMVYNNRTGKQKTFNDVKNARNYVKKELTKKENKSTVKHPTTNETKTYNKIKKQYGTKRANEWAQFNKYAGDSKKKYTKKKK